MSASAALEPAPFELSRAGLKLSGESTGDGPPIVLLHGLTATRRYVVHGSRTLPRTGFRTVAYDARGHGESEPAPPDAGYAYPELADDLAVVIDSQDAAGCVLAGHSMGAHALTALALRDPAAIAGAVIIGPTFTGKPISDESTAYWDGLADGLDRGGVEGFVAAYDEDLDPKWRETLLRITRERLSRHDHPEAVARALREVPRSRPFERLEELAALEFPVLVVASHDESDSGHPYAVAEAWAEALPDARLISEAPGESPLAWQGGKLSRAIAEFCQTEPVSARHGA